MEVKSPMLYATCLLLGLFIVASDTASAFMIAPQGYQSDQAPMVYKMPRRHSSESKFKVFAECRRDCAGKCNHSLYAYLANKIRVDFDKSKRRARRVTEFSPPVSTDSKKTVRNPLRGYMRSAQK
ncbi:unnamed protein product [Hymenolepis diminuta]|uniref:Secreted protein n=1 Tax=Hymenolepis diminuta TaxID=6216 RepID=A0A0R3SEF5_HYMDI|nr:unnamed protein product [Hymenolepis diminuta]